MIKSPFKFLDSFTLADRNIFFGRDQEITELYRRVFESKILLVYGLSGTGKSSLINCGLASRFDDSDWLPVNVRRGSNIVESLNEALNKQAVRPINKIHSASQKIQSIYLDHFKPVYLIFDQFEELSILGDSEEKSGFIKIIKEILESEIQCRVIFIIREEYLAGITEFEYDIPNIFSNRFRVEKMKRTNAIIAVEGPCKVQNIKIDPGFSEELIDKLCHFGNEIELTFLQIYLDRIFRIALTEIPEESSLKFSKELLNKAGSVSDLLGQFLEEQIKELEDPDTGMSILKSFVSIQGTKKQMDESGIMDSIGSFGTVITELDLIKYLTKFVDLRILTERDDAGHFELRHDSLALKIYEKFTAIEKDIIEVKQFIENAFSIYKKRGKLLTKDDLKYIAPYEDKVILSKQSQGFIDKSKNEAARSRNRRRIFSTVISFVLIFILSVLTIWALNERKKAFKERETASQNYLKARANNFNFLSQKVVGTDPTAALHLAEYALRLDSANKDIFENLNRIYYDNNFYRIVTRHEKDIFSVAFSPDGKSVLTGSADKTACLSDLEGNVLQVFDGHKSMVTSVTFSTDGKNILTGSSDSTARLWDLQGRVLQVFNGHEGPLSSIVVSPDGKSILTGSYDKTARLWDLQGNVLQVFSGSGSAITSVAFSPDGKNILTGSGEKFYMIDSYDRTARLWDLQGNMLQMFKDHEDEIVSVAFSPDGKSILTGSLDNTARIWDLQGNVLQVLKGHEGDLSSATYSPDGKSILTGSEDKTALLWDLQGKVLQVFKGHEGGILSVGFSPDYKSILTGSVDKTARVWELQGNLLSVFKGHDLQISSSVFSPDGKTILTGSYDETARLWDLHGNLLKVFKGHKGRIYSLAFSPDGKSILTGSDDRTARLWDLQGNVLQVFNGHEYTVFSAVFSPDGKSILTGSEDKTARLWDLQGNVQQVFKGHEAELSSVAFSPDGKSILTGSYDNTARLWDLQGNLLQLFKGYEYAVFSVAFSPDGKSILTGSYDNTARIWDLQGNLLQVFKGHENNISSVAFSPDGKAILTGSWDKTARLWNIKEPLKEFQKVNAYQELSLTQMLKYGIVIYDDVLKLEDEKSIQEAADYYLSQIDLVGKDKKNEYLNYALNLIDKLIIRFKNDSYSLKRDSLMRIHKPDTL